MASAKIHIEVNTEEVDVAVKKVERLNDLLAEANTLIGELASEGVNITVSND